MYNVLPLFWWRAFHELRCVFLPCFVIYALVNNAEPSFSELIFDSVVFCYLLFLRCNFFLFGFRTRQLREFGVARSLLVCWASVDYQLSSTRHFSVRVFGHNRVFTSISCGTFRNNELTIVVVIVKEGKLLAFLQKVAILKPFYFRFGVAADFALESGGAVFNDLAIGQLLYEDGWA